EACARLAEEAWPAGTDDGAKVIEQYGMEEYMEYAHGLSNYSEIAYTKEGVVGFLFGRIDGLPEADRPKKSMLGEVPGIFGSLVANRRLSLNMLRFTWNLLLSETKLKLRRPRSDASVEMFIVSSAHRGKGLGSDLLNRFLETARGSGSKLVTLYTDSGMSNWQFYESRGFRRVATFYDNMTSHYSGVDTKGLIYALSLNGEQP
ncbi:MAG: GNAT family N-acetyltransferase, partial [Thermoplasmata archaeon]|nr:GNAT family N-acetyltransferase [Thermoplasmata archaeon]